MCNYYAIYLRNPGSARAYIDFLRKNALRYRVQFILYPKLNELPEIFQRNKFGIKYPNFLGILYYGGDAAFFPKEFEWPGVVLDHVYTQVLEAEDYFAKHVLRFCRMKKSDSASSAVKRPREDTFRQAIGRTAYESNYYRMLDRFNREEQEIGCLLDEHRERVLFWRRANADKLRVARLDKERIDSCMRRWVYPGVKRTYDEWVARNPGKTPAERNEFYSSLFETELRKARFHPQFKYPLDLIESLYASKPHKSPELKERIAEHKKLGEELDRIGPEAKQSGDDWDDDISEQLRRINW